MRRQPVGGGGGSGGIQRGRSRGSSITKGAGGGACLSGGGEGDNERTDRFYTIIPPARPHHRCAGARYLSGLLAQIRYWVFGIGYWVLGDAGRGAVLGEAASLDRVPMSRGGEELGKRGDGETESLGIAGLVLVLVAWGSGLVVGVLMNR
jgi:hypothetical protein